MEESTTVLQVQLERAVTGDAEARQRLRQQALALLRADVAAQAQQLPSARPAEAASAREVLEHLRFLPVLAGVSNPALASLPESER